MKKILSLLLFFIISMSSFAYASKLRRAFDAMEIYNYFEAKRLFEKSIKKHPFPACYGMSMIYARRDNPFSNLDSAHVMIVRSFNSFMQLNPKIKLKYEKSISLDSTKLVEQRKRITQLYFDRSIETNSVFGYQDFISKNSWSSLVDSAVILRDQLAFKKAKEGGKSSDFLEYAQAFPESRQSDKAMSLYHQTLFQEETYSNNYVDYLNFVRKYPDSPFRTTAEDKIYEIATRTGTIESYRNFIEENANNRNVPIAWKRLFNAEMRKEYSSEAISIFEKDYPNYPYQTELQVEKKLADQLLFPFQRDQKWGAIDSSGATLIPEQFEQLEWFSEGLAVFKDEDKYGYINKMGKIIVPAQYNDALAFNEGYALVELDDKWGMIDRNGELVIPIQYEELGVLNNGLSYFVEDERYGYLDEKGKVRIPAQYDEAYDFENGYAVVSKNQFYGVIDEFATTYLPYQFQELFQLKDKLFLAKFRDSWGIVNLAKDTVVSFIYDFIGTESEGWRIVESADEYNFIDENGKLLSEKWFVTYPEYRAFSKFQNGYVKIKENDQFVLMDTSGKSLYKKGVQDVGQYSDVIAVKQNDSWGFRDKEGKDVIKPEYDFAESFRGEVAIVVKGPLFGLVNQQNEVIIPILQESMSFLNDSLLVVKRLGKYGLMTIQGDTLVAVKQKKIEHFSDKIVRIYRENEVFYYHLENKYYIRKEE